MTGTVLVVDDEPMMRSVVSRQLIDAGFEVLVASDGEEGLKLFETHQDKIVLVLLDVVMPRMGGFECLDHLRTLAPQLPAVVHSGFARDQLDARRAQTEDFVFLKKPYSRTALLSTIRRALSPRADEGAFATELPG